MNISGFYTIEVASIQLGESNTTTTLIGENFHTSIVDTGTSELLLPSSAYNSLVQALIGDANVTAVINPSIFLSSTNGSLTCSTAGVNHQTLDKLLPPLLLTVVGSNKKNATIRIPATSSYLTAVTTSANNIVSTLYCPAIGDKGTAPTDNYITIIGNTIMHNFIYIFDRKNKQLGIAPGKGCVKLP